MNEYGVLVEWHCDRKSRSTYRKPCLSVTLSTRNVTWAGLGSNLGPCDNGLATNHPSHGEGKKKRRRGGGSHCDYSCVTESHVNTVTGRGVTVTTVVWLSPMWILLLETCLPNEFSHSLTMTVEGTMAHSSTGNSICMGSSSCQWEIPCSLVRVPIIIKKRVNFGVII